MILAIVGLAVTLLWFLAGIWYVGTFIGFGTLFLLMPNELGQFFIGFFAPLAFLWLVLAYLHFGQRMRRLEDSIWEIAAVRLPRVEASTTPARAQPPGQDDAPPLPPPWTETRAYTPPQPSAPPASPPPASLTAPAPQPAPPPAAPQPQLASPAPASQPQAAPPPSAPAEPPPAEMAPPWWRTQEPERAPPPGHRVGSASEVYESRMRRHAAGPAAAPPANDWRSPPQAPEAPSFSNGWPGEPPRETRPEPAPRQSFDDRRYSDTWSSFERATLVERDWRREGPSSVAPEISPPPLQPPLAPRLSPPVEEPRTAAPRGYMVRRSDPPPQRPAAEAAPPAAPPAEVDESMVVQPYDDPFAPPSAAPRFRSDPPRPATLRPEPPRPDPLRPNPLRPNPARANPPRPELSRPELSREAPARDAPARPPAPRPAPSASSGRSFELQVEELPRRSNGNGSATSSSARPAKAVAPPSAPREVTPPSAPPSRPAARPKAKKAAPAKPKEPAEGSVANRPIGFRHLVRITSMELNSIAMDLSAALSRDAEHAQALKGYDKGEKDVFFDLLCSKMSEQPPVDLVEHLRDLGAEHLLGNYAHKFQSLIAESKKVDRSGALGKSLETMPIGRLHTRIEAVQAAASPH